jgi:PKHD-type hydroxylase
VLTQHELTELRAIAARVRWDDGRKTAGYAAKLPAGDLLLYPANTVHHVARITRGTWLAMIFWTQSMVRDAQQRALLYAMFQTLENLEKPLAATPELTQLYAYYYLTRMWATP